MKSYLYFLVLPVDKQTVQILLKTSPAQNQTFLETEATFIIIR